MKGVILAAGEGSRLRPLTNTRPKPMLPVANRPVLEYVIDATREAGIDEVVLVVGYKADRIQDYFQDGDDFGVAIEYAFQDTQLGTGDAVARAAEYVSDTFVVLNGDRILDPSVIEAVATERRTTGDPSIAVTHFDEPGLYGVVERDDDGYVTDIQEKPPQHAISTDLINAGVYGFGPEIFDRIADTSRRGELPLTAVLSSDLAEHPVRTVPYTGRWLDVTRPWDLVAVNTDLLDAGGGDRAESAAIEPSAYVTESAAIGANSRVYPNASVLRGTAIGTNVRIESNATVRNSILMDDVRVGAGSVIQDAIIGENASIAPNTTIPGGPADVYLDGTEHPDVVFGGVVGDNATVGANATVTPGTLVGNGAVVFENALLDGHIEPNATVRRG